MVALPETSVGIVDEMRQYNHKTMVVDEVVNARNNTTTYTTISLVGCESKAGKPYWFINEWLIPMVERAEQ